MLKFTSRKVVAKPLLEIYNKISETIKKCRNFILANEEVSS